MLRNKHKSKGEPLLPPRKTVPVETGETAAEPAVHGEPMAENKIYWAPARRYALYLSKDDPERVGIYQRETRSLRGDVLQPARPIVFGEHIFATDDQAAQAVIERSTAFRDGEIVLCKDQREAEMRTVAQSTQKRITSGMVTMVDETGRIANVDEVAAVISRGESLAGGDA